MELIKSIEIWTWLDAIFGAIMGSIIINLVQKRSYVHAVLAVVAFTIFIITLLR